MNEPKIDFSNFFSYANLKKHITALAKWKPDMATIHKIGKSPGGRDVLLMEINNPRSGPAEDKPAYLVHGNIHAAEVSGSASSLYLAHHLLVNAERNEEAKKLLDRIAFYICPRVSVEGADTVLLQGRSVRSRETAEKRKNCIWPQDLNGDGRIAQMRIPDPNGEMIAFDDDPRLLFTRLPGDEGGKRHRVTTEGVVHDWDGGPWSGPHFKYLDFNRNWGANWKPQHEQGGAGRYSFSEPEVRAIADFVFDHPNIFGMLGFHTGPSAVLRPPSSGGEDSIEPDDLGVYRKLGALGSEITGFPIKAIHEYRSAFYPPSDYWGHFPDWGYKALGQFVFEIELGTLYNSVGFTTDEIFGFTDLDYRELERKLMAYHDEHPDEVVFMDWKTFKHPQFGAVEIGGWMPVGRANVAKKDRLDIWERSRQFIFELASRAPRLEIHNVQVEPLGSRLFRVSCRVANEGYLPTSVTRLGARVADVEGVVLEVERTKGVELISNRNYTNIGNLSSSQFKELHWVVRTPAKGKASLTLAAHAARAGKTSVSVNLIRRGFDRG